MLIHLADLTIAQYETAAELSRSEIEQADIVKIRGFHDGGMYHSRSMVWKGFLPPDLEPLQFIRSKSERKAMKRNLAHLAENQYEVKTVPLTEELFAAFVPIYEQRLQQLKRPMRVDFDEQVRTKLLLKKKIYLAGIFLQHKLVSGLIFSVKNNEVVVSLGAKVKFPGLKGGIGGVLELALLEFCKNHSIQHISHGKSPNPAGITTSAGVFEFKVRHGFCAFPTEYWETTFIRSFDTTISDLVFVGIKNSALCYYVVSNESAEIIKKKYLPQEIGELEIVKPAELEAQFAALLARLPT